MAGLTNAQYAYWMSNTAIEDCSSIAQLFIKFVDGMEECYTDNSVICTLMQNATETQVSTFQKVIFSGYDQGDWSAVDERLTTNLERTQNNGYVPVKIKRPIGW